MQCMFIGCKNVAAKRIQSGPLEACFCNLHAERIFGRTQALLIERGKAELIPNVKMDGKLPMHQSANAGKAQATATPEESANDK